MQQDPFNIFVDIHLISVYHNNTESPKIYFLTRSLKYIYCALEKR